MRLVTSINGRECELPFYLEGVHWVARVIIRVLRMTPATKLRYSPVDYGTIAAQSMPKAPDNREYSYN